jgi:hypothetical protein
MPLDMTGSSGGGGETVDGDDVISVTARLLHALLRLVDVIELTERR